MHASTHTFGSNTAADSSRARARETKTKYVGAATTIRGVAPRLDPQRGMNECADLRSRSLWISDSLAKHVETAFFAVTLSAIGCLLLGVLPAQVF